MRIDTTLTADLFGPIPGAQLSLFAPPPAQVATLAPDIAPPVVPARKSVAPLLAARRAERLAHPDSIGPAIDRYRAEQNAIRKAARADARKYFDVSRTIAARAGRGEP